jgi:hypothetical protein
MIPLAHRTNGPAFILNKENFNATFNMKALFYAQNGVLHSDNSPAIFADGHIAFYFFGKNKTVNFKESINIKIPASILLMIISFAIKKIKTFLLAKKLLISGIFLLKTINS